MLAKRHTGVAAGAAVLLGAFVVAGMGQQKSGRTVVTGSNRQATAMAEEQAQVTSQSSSLPPGTHQGTGNSTFPSTQSDEVSPYVQEQVRLKRNDERQRKLESDTGRLLALANLLKGEIAASGSETMTPEMLRQMDEIEKLARSVKDRMRN